MVPNIWMRIGLETWRFGIEATTVMTLRTVKIMTGGRAGEAEARRMVAEKISASGELQSRALVGQLGSSPEAATLKTLKHYGLKVRTNRRRLGRSRSKH
jgi:hypothetical protein